eukprot:Ihof_evm1s1145 gene=Ihof_evmTU1s1145
MENYDKFRAMLIKLTASKTLIKNATEYCLNHTDDWEILYQSIRNRLQESLCLSQRVAVLYLIDSICNLSVKRDITVYLHAIGSDLPDLIEELLMGPREREKRVDGDQMSLAAAVRKVTKVLKIWKDKVFSPQLIENAVFRLEQVTSLETSPNQLQTEKSAISRRSTPVRMVPVQNQDFAGGPPVDPKHGSVIKWIENDRRERRKRTTEKLFRPDNDPCDGEFNEWWATIGPANEPTPSRTQIIDLIHRRYIREDSLSCLLCCCGFESLHHLDEHIQYNQQHKHNVQSVLGREYSRQSIIDATFSFPNQIDQFSHHQSDKPPGPPPEDQSQSDMDIDDLSDNNRDILPNIIVANNLKGEGVVEKRKRSDSNSLLNQTTNEMPQSKLMMNEIGKDKGDKTESNDAIGVEESKKKVAQAKAVHWAELREKRKQFRAANSLANKTGDGEGARPQREGEGEGDNKDIGPRGDGLLDIGKAANLHKPPLEKLKISKPQSRMERKRSHSPVSFRNGAGREREVERERDRDRERLGSGSGSDRDDIRRDYVINRDQFGRIRQVDDVDGERGWDGRRQSGKFSSSPSRGGYGPPRMYSTEIWETRGGGYIGEKEGWRERGEGRGRERGEGREREGGRGREEGRGRGYGEIGDQQQYSPIWKDHDHFWYRDDDRERDLLEYERERERERERDRNLGWYTKGVSRGVSRRKLSAETRDWMDEDDCKDKGDTERHKDGMKEKDRERERDRDRAREREGEVHQKSGKDKGKHKEKERVREREKKKEKERNRDKEREKEKDKEDGKHRSGKKKENKDSERDRKREGGRERERERENIIEDVGEIERLITPSSRVPKVVLVSEKSLLKANLQGDSIQESIEQREGETETEKENEMIGQERKTPIGIMDLAGSILSETTGNFDIKLDKIPLEHVTTNESSENISKKTLKFNENDSHKLEEQGISQSDQSTGKISSEILLKGNKEKQSRDLLVDGTGESMGVVMGTNKEGKEGGGAGQVVRIWDLDETLIIFTTLLNGKFSRYHNL